MPYFFRKLGKVSQNLSSAAVVIGALRVKFGRCVMHETMVIIPMHFHSKLQCSHNSFSVEA